MISQNGTKVRGGTFYHSHTVLYSHHFALNNVSKYHANDNYNAMYCSYAKTSSRAESIETRVAIKNITLLFL